MPGTIVLNPATVDGYGNPISVTRDEYIGANRLLTSSKIVAPVPIPSEAKNAVGVDFYRRDLSANTTYGIVVDLDNGSGIFKHDIIDGYVKLVGASGILIKNKNSDIWGVIYGTILSIDDTEATIGWLQVGALHAADTNVFTDRYALQTFPVAIDLTVENGDYVKIAAGYKEVVTEVNTSTPIYEQGQYITPAVGDVIARATRESGTGAANIHFSLWYYVE